MKNKFSNLIQTKVQMFKLSVMLSCSDFKNSHATFRKRYFDATNAKTTLSRHITTRRMKQKNRR